MSQPPPYTPDTQFIAYQSQQAWFPGQELDVEFNDLATTIASIRTNLAILQNDDGTLGRGLVGWDQFAPSLQVALRAQGFTGTFTSGPNTWVGLQTFPNGLTSASYALGAGNSSHSFIDLEPNTNPAGYTNAVSPFFFSDLTTAGWSFSDANFHVAVSLNGNKVTTASVGSGTGSYTALQVSQFSQGGGASTYLTGALLQSVAVFNPNGQNRGLFFGANPQVVIPAAGGGVITADTAVAMELDLLLQQNVGIKQALRIYDYYAGIGTTTQNSSAIRILKAPAGGGWTTGLVFASDYSAGYLDSGFPIIAGGTMIAGQTTSLSLASALNLSGMLGGFSVAAIVLPTGTIANNGIIWGPAGLGGYIISGVNSGGGGILFANGLTYFQFGGANAVWMTTGTTDGRIGFIGTGGGTTTLATANAGASVFTLTLPAITDTIVTLTAGQTLTNKILTSPTINTPSIGTATFSGITTFNRGGDAAGSIQLLSGASGTFTLMGVGRTSSEFAFGVAGGSNQFFTGTVAGDSVVYTPSGNQFLGTVGAATVVKVVTSNALATTIDATQNLTQVGFLKGSTLYASGDAGGVASTNALSNANSTTISSGTGTVKMSSTNSANNAVWVKIYAGTTAYWVPGWTTNAP